MRLWHCELLPYLPELQFKGQLRELVAIMHIDEQPTAAVVPKSEVERLQQDNDDLRNILADTLNKYRNCETEVAKEIFEEIERYVIKGISVGGEHLTLFNGKNYAELKKKYIGDSEKYKQKQNNEREKK